MKSKNMSEVLYISLDGMMEPLGQSQVLKYLEKLSATFQINLISFEKIHDLENTKLLNEIIKKCAENQISWYRLKYRNGYFGLGQIVNILNLFFLPLYIFIKKNISLVHIRSYVPGIFLPVHSLFFKFKIIFDIRGFWADEKHDRLNWSKKSLKFRFFKKLEAYLMRHSKYIVTLTNASKSLIVKNFNVAPASLFVIPTCVDFEEFRRVERINKKPNNLTIGYLGSIDTAYDFTRFCFLISELQKNLKYSINLKVLTNQSSQNVSALIPKKILSKILLEVKFVERSKLSNEISSFDFLGFYLKENYSIVASMPTKIGETLACGVPIVCNPFNADICDLLEENEAGMIYNFDNDLTQKELKKIVHLLNNDTSMRCISTASKHFALERGVSQYLNLYSKIIL